MVKGISRQVIVVDAPEPKLFEQAIFILREDMEGITDETLLKEAQKTIQGSGNKTARKRHIWLYGAFWAAVGALATGAAWLMTLWI